MFIVIGERLLGQVERVPGTSYVATMFFHLWYVPFWPLQSYLVSEGSEVGGKFHGIPIALDFKSVLIGFLRSWLGATAVLTTLATAIAVACYFGQGREDIAVPTFIVVVCGLFGLLWFILSTSTRGFITAQTLLIAATSIWSLRVVGPAMDGPDAAHDLVVQLWPAALGANVALLAYNLTRLATHKRAEPPDVMPIEEFESSVG